MKVRVIKQADETFAYGGQDADAIREAVASRTQPGGVPDLYDITDMYRSDMDADEYLIATEDDGTPVWSGWLGGVTGPPPPDRGALKEAVLAAIGKFEADLGFTAPELTGMRIDQLRGRVGEIFEPADDEDGDTIGQPS